MRLESQIRDGVCILRLQGRFVTGSDAELGSARNSLQEIGIAKAVDRFARCSVYRFDGLGFCRGTPQIPRQPRGTTVPGERQPAGSRSPGDDADRRNHPAVPGCGGRGSRTPRVKCCADVSGVVRGAVLLLAAGAGGADFVSADLAAAVAFPDRGHRGGRSAGAGVGDRHFAGAGFAAGLGIQRGTVLQYCSVGFAEFARAARAPHRITNKWKNSATPAHTRGSGLIRTTAPGRRSPAAHPHTSDCGRTVEAAGHQLLGRVQGKRRAPPERSKIPGTPQIHGDANGHKRKPGPPECAEMTCGPGPRRR
jgi:hypothetical protein